MADAELVIKLPEEAYNLILGKIDTTNIDLYSTLIQAVKNGTLLPKGHGRLFDERDIVNGNYEVIGNRIYELESVIEADNLENEAERSLKGDKI